MKVIFGCEMYMIDDEAPMITNPKDKKIDEEEFVVFDIETTGLNSHTNKIIEIGAVKIKAGRIIDRYSQLINPGIAIPYHITEITSITNEQVANQPKIDEVIGKFVEFIGDAVLVAHNAPFDMGFIKRDIKEYLNIDLESSVIDTLQMARDLFPDFKKYGLGDLNKALGLALEKHHRAVDDSQATANMFIIFLEKYKEKGIEYLKDINKGFEVNVKKQSLKNIMVQVKTQEGLKNMYKFRKGELLGNLEKKNVILVDEGCESGLTALTCIKTLVSLNAKAIFYATPVIGSDNADEIAMLVDGIYAVHKIRDFVNVDFYYKEKTLSSAEEIMQILNKCPLYLPFHETNKNKEKINAVQN